MCNLYSYFLHSDLLVKVCIQWAVLFCPVVKIINLLLARLSSWKNWISEPLLGNLMTRSELYHIETDKAWPSKVCEDAGKLYLPVYPRPPAFVLHLPDFC